MRNRVVDRRNQLTESTISTLYYTAQKFRYIFEEGDGSAISDLYFSAGSLVVLLKAIHPRFPIDPNSSLVRFVEAVETRRYAAAGALFALMGDFIREAGRDKEKLVMAMLLVLCPLTAKDVP